MKPNPFPTKKPKNSNTKPFIIWLKQNPFSLIKICFRETLNVKLSMKPSVTPPKKPSLPLRYLRSLWNPLYHSDALDFSLSTMNPLMALKEKFLWATSLSQTQAIHTFSLYPFGKTSHNVSLMNASFHLMTWIHPHQCLSLGCLMPFRSRIILIWIEIVVMREREILVWEERTREKREWTREERGKRRERTESGLQEMKGSPTVHISKLWCNLWRDK